MARTKQRAITASGPMSLDDFSKLARTLHAQKEAAEGSDGSTTATTTEAEEKDDGSKAAAPKRRISAKSSEVSKGSSGSKKDDMPPPPVPPKRKLDKEITEEPPSKISKTGKLERGKSKILTEADMEKAEQFSPSALPFSLGWNNFQKLKDFYELDDHETTSILLAMVGPTPEGKALWSKFKAPRQYSDPATAVANTGEISEGLDGEPMDEDDEDYEEGEEEEGQENADPVVAVTAANGPALDKAALDAQNQRSSATEDGNGTVKKEPR